MKSTLFVLLAGGLFSLASCGDGGKYDADTKDSTGNSNSTTEPASSSEAYASVPQPAKTNFESRYPQATNVKWEHFEPVPVEADATVYYPEWMTSLDTSDYQVNFNWDGMDYIAWYDNGEWIGSTARMTDNSKLPKAVNDAIHERYPDYTITEVDKQNDKNMTVYEVDLEKGKDKLKITFDENGKTLKAKGKVSGEKVKAKEDTK
jgi:hypothetical protein